MNKYCKDIESKIVDYFEESLNIEERKIFSDHIARCRDCKIKYDEFSNTKEILKSLKEDTNIIVSNSSDKMFERILEKRNKYNFSLKLVSAVALVVILLFGVFVYSSISYKESLMKAQEMDLNISYFIDLEEEIINSDEETFEQLSAIIFGDDYKDFEDILEETSLIKP